MRKSPWELQKVVQRGFELLILSLMPGSGADQASRLYAILDQPLSVAAHEFRRRHALLYLSDKISVQKTEEILLKWFEPDPIWDESFLSKRVAAYQAAGEPNLKKARRDLMRYRRAANPFRGRTAAPDAALNHQRRFQAAGPGIAIENWPGRNFRPSAPRPGWLRRPWPRESGLSGSGSFKAV